MVGNDLYRGLVENGSEGTMAFDRDLRLMIWNRGMIRMTGLERDDCVGKPVSQVLAGLGVLGIEKSLATTLQGRSETLQSLSFRNRDTAKVCFFEANYHPLRDLAGAVVGGMVVVRDVTERSGLEKALIESEHKHRLRFMHGGDANLIIDRQGRYIDANPAVYDLTGYSVEELLTMRVSALSTPDERPTAKKWFDDLVAKGVSRSERIIRRKDGTCVHTEVHAIDLGDGTFQLSIRDMTQRRAAEEQLHQALERLRFHIDRMPLGYIGWSTEMEIVEWNSACERIFGWSAREILGKDWKRLVPEFARPPVEKIIDKVFAGDTSSHSINENLRKDGTVITCEWFNTPLRDSGGTIKGAASIVHDVTERRLAESQLRHAQKMESLGVLTRGIAHDFGNLLTVVQGNVTLLKHMPDFPERAREYLELIDKASSKASELTDHLLAFARTGRHKPELSDLNEIVTGAINLLRGSFGRGIEVNTELDETIPKIEIDKSQTEQIVMNLCLNAAQAMPSGGTIAIRTLLSQLGPRVAARCLPPDHPSPGRRVELVVSDTGQGMDEATISRIFDPFFTTKRTGHGLGLAAVLGILKQHRAHVVTDSAPGKGTTFHLYFPILNADSERAKDTLRSPRSRAKGTVTSSRKRRSTGRKTRPPRKRR